ncbi:MAG: hypothetical protein FWF94_06560 [Oscillospiraceae bacterium]|nr:hypothetical protein [Oscillospiraceae bacterium]
MKRAVSIITVLVFSLCITLTDIGNIVKTNTVAGALETYEFTTEVIKLVNEIRAEEELERLSGNHFLLNAAATLRAYELTEFWSGTRPDGSNFWTILDEYEIERIDSTQLIGRGYDSPSELVQAFADSPDLLKNLLSDRTHIGVGFLHNSNNQMCWVLLLLKIACTECKLPKNSICYFCGVCADCDEGTFLHCATCDICEECYECDMCEACYNCFLHCTCEEPPACENGHDLWSSNCTRCFRCFAYDLPRSCSNSSPCSQHRCESKGHSWSSWSPNDSGFCTKGGIQTRACFWDWACGVAPESKWVSALGHNLWLSNCSRCFRCGLTNIKRTCTTEKPCSTHKPTIIPVTFHKGRILDNNAKPTIFDFIEILKYLVNIENEISIGGVGSRAWNAALITPESTSPTIFDGIEILKYLVGIENYIGENTDVVVNPHPIPGVKPTFWHDDSNKVGFWNKSSITVHSQTVGTVSSGFNFSSWTSEALGKWTSALGVNISSTSSQASSDIQAYGGRKSVICEISGESYWPDSRVGMCKWVYSTPEAGTFSANGATRWVYRYNAAKVYVLELYSDWSQNNVNLTKHTTIHEFGHALGYMSHPFDIEANKSDIMYPYTSPSLTLSANERKHLRQIYDYYRN